MKLPVIILGSGGHAKVVLNCLLLQSIDILGMTDQDPNRWNKSLVKTTVLGGDDILKQYSPDKIRLVNGIGSVDDITIALRKQIYERHKALGYCFTEVIHPSAVIANDVILDEGAQVMAGAVLQPGCKIGKNSIVNTMSSVDHDCVVGANVHLAPGAVLSGSVLIEDEVLIGTGAIVIQGISIGRKSIIGAGAAIHRDIPSGSKVVKPELRELK